MKKQLLMMASAAFLLAGCQKEKNELFEDTSHSEDSIKVYQPIALSTQSQKEMVGSGNEFSFRFFQEIIKSTDKENLFVSPLGLANVLAMTANGAGGTTSQEMIDVLGFKKFSQDQLNAYYQKLTAALLTADEQVKLSIANSLWMKDGFFAYPDFLKINQACYNAEVTTLPFDQEGVDRINAWSAKKTENCIPEIINNINPNCRMLLLNALYFKGTWTVRFEKDKTVDRTFTKADGTELTMKQMNQKMEILTNIKNEYFNIMELPYGNGMFNMIVFIPKVGVSMNKAIDALTAQNVAEWTASLKKTIEEVGLPRFKQESEFDLIPVMKKLGMISAFAESADFSKLSKEQVNVSLLAQNTYITVDEAGTEAGATTIEGSNSVDSDYPFRVNRPFFFLIRENASQAVLFMGKIGAPEE